MPNIKHEYTQQIAHKDNNGNIIIYDLGTTASRVEYDENSGNNGSLKDKIEQIQKNISGNALINKLYPNPNFINRGNEYTGQWEFTNSFINTYNPYMCCFGAPYLWNGCDNIGVAIPDVENISTEYTDDIENKSLIYNPLGMEDSILLSSNIKLSSQYSLGSYAKQTVNGVNKLDTSAILNVFYQNEAWVNTKLGKKYYNMKDPLPYTFKIGYTGNEYKSYDYGNALIADYKNTPSTVCLNMRPIAEIFENAIDIVNNICYNFVFQFLFTNKILEDSILLSIAGDRIQIKYVYGQGIQLIVKNEDESSLSTTEYILINENEINTFKFSICKSNNDISISIAKADNNYSDIIYSITLDYDYRVYGYIKDCDFKTNGNFAIYSYYMNIDNGNSILATDLVDFMKGIKRTNIPSTYTLYNTGLLSSIDINFINKVLSIPQILINYGNNSQLTGFEPKGSIEFLYEDPPRPTDLNEVEKIELSYINYYDNTSSSYIINCYPKIYWSNGLIDTKCTEIDRSSSGNGYLAGVKIYLSNDNSIILEKFYQPASGSGVVYTITTGFVESETNVDYICIKTLQTLNDSAVAIYNKGDIGKITSGIY